MKKGDPAMIYYGVLIIIFGLLVFYFSIMKEFDKKLNAPDGGHLSYAELQGMKYDNGDKPVFVVVFIKEKNALKADNILKEKTP